MVFRAGFTARVALHDSQVEPKLDQSKTEPWWYTANTLGQLYLSD